MSTEPVIAKVSKQWTVQLFEVGKSAVAAGITSALSLLYLSIDAGHLPTLDDLKKAGMVGLVTMVGAILRYWVNPTTTTIKGQIDPTSIVVPQTGTVITKDSQ